MLVLNFRSGETVMIGDDIKIRVVDMGNYIRLAFDAPRDVPILRQSVYAQQNPDSPKNLEETYHKSVWEIAEEQARSERRAREMQLAAAAEQRKAGKNPASAV